jgi:ABC-type bacteriocin/lantibiotic exporter with double-glycine peptidase domain
MTINRIFKILTKQQKARLSILVIFQLLASMLDAIGIISLLPFLTLILDPGQLSDDGYLSDIYSYFKYQYDFDVNLFLIVLGVISAGLIFLSTITRAYLQYHLNKYIELNRILLSTRLLDIYLHSNYSSYSKHPTANASKTIISEVDYFIDKVFRAIVLGLAHVIFVIILGSIFFLINPTATFLALGSFMFFYLIVFMLLGNFIRDAGDSLSQSNEKRHKYIYDSVNMIKMIKIKNLEKFFLKKYENAAKISGFSIARYMTANQTSNFIIEGLIFTVVILISVVLIVNNGGVEAPIIQQYVPYLALFSYAVIRIKPSMQSIYAGISSLRFGDSIIENLINNNIANENDRNNIIKKASDNNITFEDMIELKDISFSYDNSKNYQISNISLKIIKNQCIGIIGKSGAGKSTLLDLLLGLIEPSFGEILIDKKTLNLSNCNAWQNKIGYVPQHVSLLNDSLIRNLLINLNITDERIASAHECLKLAQLDEFLSKLEPENINQAINENNISGGQKQRLGIARALFSNPEILVLDEITNSLDKAMEKEVIETIYNIENKTKVLVTHNEEILYGCDQIVRIENGSVISIS